MSDGRAGWVFVPVLGSALLHAPVLILDLGSTRPISARHFGANKTWRGAAVMQTGAMLATVALFRVPAYRERLPPEVADADPAVVGALLGLAVWTGELPNSFVKRRLGIAPGQQARGALGLAISIIDQADWVPAACLYLRPVWRMRPAQAAGVFAAVVAAHMVVNRIGFAIGARKSRV